MLADFKNELSSISSNELKAIPADFATSLNNSERETVMTAFSSVNTGKVSGFVASIANAVRFVPYMFWGEHNPFKHPFLADMDLE